jgi:glucose/mannose-6-phosphate isomerase
MGGSAIGGDYAGFWAGQQGLSLRVHRGYGVPAWVGEETLLLFSSYSGTTEEVLSAYDESPPRCAKLCITTGGALRERARADGVPVLLLPAGLQPRAALGHSLVAVLLVLEAAGLLQESPLPEIVAAQRHLEAMQHELSPEVPEERNRAKQLSRACANRPTWIWTGNGALQPVGRRWQAQWNENAKTLAWASVLPEMCHNEIMAPPSPQPLCEATQVLALADPGDPAPVLRRMQLLERLLSPHLAGVQRLQSRGETTLVRMLRATFLGDYTSVYLAFLRGVDPTPVQRIQELKQRLRDSA